MDELEMMNDEAAQTEQAEEQDSAAPETEAASQDSAEDLRAALLEASVKLALLLCGAARERLDEAAKLAYGLCAAGKTPDEAAEEVMAGYPHLRAVQRDIPQLAAQSGGRNDGFSAIRSIFSRK
ncbi:MAG: hypothetical protein ACI4XA_07760 [Oscillospiraceae bacterium]